MDNDFDFGTTSADLVEAIRSNLDRETGSTGRRIFEKFLLAAISNIPWIGSFMGAAASLKFDASSVRKDQLLRRWFEEHERKIDRLRTTLLEIERRFESLGAAIDERVQSDQYLDLVRSAFRAWDRADTDEKRKYVANLITNAAGSRLCSDDIVRLFIEWLDTYHEAHFAVIREIYNSPGCTRYEIGKSLYGDLPRDDSAEADLFRRLVRELSIGDVIRQVRDTNELGQFKRRPSVKKGPRSPVLESSFEDEKPYVLTELGKQFVHYTMSEIVPRLEETGHKPGGD